MSVPKQVGSEVIVALQNQFRDKVSDSVQRFLSKVDKRRLGDSTMGTASTNLIMAMNRAGNWYASSLEKVVRKEMKEVEAEKKKSKAPRAPNPALTRSYNLSYQLSELMGTSTGTRQEALRQIWAYANNNGLKDPNQKGKIRVDAKLSTILGPGDAEGFVRNTDIMKYLSAHVLGPAEK